MRFPSRSVPSRRRAPTVGRPLPQPPFSRPLPPGGPPKFPLAARFGPRGGAGRRREGVGGAAASSTPLRPLPPRPSAVGEDRSRLPPAAPGSAGLALLRAAPGPAVGDALALGAGRPSTKGLFGGGEEGRAARRGGDGRRGGGRGRAELRRRRQEQCEPQRSHFRRSLPCPCLCWKILCRERRLQLVRGRTVGIGGREEKLAPSTTMRSPAPLGSALRAQDGSGQHRGVVPRFSLLLCLNPGT